MRRAFALVLSASLLVAFAAPAIASAPVADDAAVVLAAAAGDPVGPDPKPRLAEDNPARELAGYENPDVPFTWGAAWILTFTGFVGLALLVGLYYLLVHRPRQGAGSTS